MTTIYDSTRQVKSNTFARGILARPTEGAPNTQSDRAWWAQESAAIESARLDAMVDELFAEAEAIRRLELGIAL
jgi:hypothetical protein